MSGNFIHPGAVDPVNEARIFASLAAGFGSQQITSTGTLVYSFASDSQQAADRWLMFFDALALPPDGTAPLWTAYLPPNGAQRAEQKVLTVPLIFLTGLWVAISDSHLVLGSGGVNSTNHNFFAQFST